MCSEEETRTSRFVDRGPVNDRPCFRVGVKYFQSFCILFRSFEKGNVVEECFRVVCILVGNVLEGFDTVLEDFASLGDIVVEVKRYGEADPALAQVGA